MPAKHDITTHPLLSELSASLQASSACVFDANVELAEHIHDLRDDKYLLAEFAPMVELILVHQVNFQVENDGNMEVYESVKEGDTTYNYRDQFGVSMFADMLRKKMEGYVSSISQKGSQRTGSVKNSALW